MITDGSHHRHDHSAPKDTYDLQESIEGFGCNSSHIPERKNGYSEDYPEGCRNWQAMPVGLYSPHFKYWIDESSLSPLSDEEKETFIDNVDAAAVEWNSVRIKDYSSPIVELIKVSSNGAGVVPVSYDEDLPVLGRFNPIPFNYWIKLREFTGRTPLHEFGHMLGLQDLDMGDGPDVHDVLMGYTGEPLQYQDIQGLAVRHYKHQIHDYRKYYKVGLEYKYVCFYCDLTDSLLINLSGSSHLVETSNCIHSYQEIVSAGNRIWQKCTECYKVIESEFIVNGIDTDLVEITGLIGNPIRITIPGQIGGQNVIRIADNAFAQKTSISEIVFDTFCSIAHIGDHAFSGLTRLTSITIPHSVQHIGSYAFAGCSNLTSIYFSNNTNLDRLNEYTFLYCRNLTHITIPSSVTWIGNSAFGYCTGLETVSFAFNSQLEVIDDFAFQYCSNLSFVQIPASVYRIGRRSFDRCSNLASLTFRPFGQLSLLGSAGFASCESLTRIVIPEGVKTIPSGLFAGCTNLESITFEGPVETIERYAFRSCASLDNVILPNSLTTIEDYAFEFCTNLSYILIPSSTVHIWPNAFAGCTNLDIDFENIPQDTLLPNQYEFANEYNNESITKTVTSSQENDVITRRLRTGYINANDGTGRKFITMSGKAAGQYEAYLEYEYDYPIESIDYQLALWGPNETLIRNSSIRLEAKDGSDSWQIIRTFTASQMGQNKESLVDYESNIAFSSNTFRFIIQTTHNITNPNNVGRVVIGDVTVDGQHVCNHDTSNAQVPHDEDYHMTYCYCGIAQLMPHSIFTYTPIYTSYIYDLVNHEKRCSCGQFIANEPHSWVLSSDVPGPGFLYCADCLLVLIR